MQLIQSRCFKVFWYLIVIFFLTPFLYAQGTNYICGTQNDLTIIFTVPVHEVGNNEINRVAVWIHVNPIGAIDENTTFTLVSPYDTSPDGFDNDGVERELFDPLTVPWLISLTPYATGTALRIKRIAGSNDIRINESTGDQTWELTISNFSPTIELNSLDISIISKTWDSEKFVELSSSNYLAEINPNPCNQPPVISEFIMTQPADPVTLPGDYIATFEVVTANDPDGSIIDYEWDINPPPESHTDTNPNTVTFTTENDYMIRVRAIDDDGAYSPFSILTLNLDAPAVDFTGTPQACRAGDVVFFSIDGIPDDWDNGTIVETIWNFGDGETTPSVMWSQVPHIYANATDNPINFDVSLTVIDNTNLMATVTKLDYISVSPENDLPYITYYPPVLPTEPVDFNISGATYTMHFHAVGNDPDGLEEELTYTWNFQDELGNPITPDPPEPPYDPDQHKFVTFSEPGTYTVTVYVTDPDGDNSTQIEKTYYLIPPDASFNCDPMSGRDPLTVTFTNTSTAHAENTIQSFEWDYSDGTGNDILERYNTIHAHEFSEGTYTVTLAVIDDMNLKTEISSSGPITVGSPNNNPVITGDITYQRVSGEVGNPDLGNPCTLEFTVAASDEDEDPLTYYWTFDGVLDDTQNSNTVTHEYYEENSHNVSVTVEDDYGGYTTSSRSFGIYLPVADFNYDPPGGQTDVSITFTNASHDDGTIIQASLIIDDEGSFSEPYITDPPLNILGSPQYFSFPDAITYHIRLEVEDNLHFFDNKDIQIDIQAPIPGNPPTITSFDYVIPDNPTPLEEYTLKFKGTAVDDCECQLTYTFTLPDSTEVTRTGVSGSPVETDFYVFNVPETYTAYLTVTDNADNTCNPLPREFTISAPEVEIYTYDAQEGRSPFKVTFGQNSNDDEKINEYIWEFDRGNDGTVEHTLPLSKMEETDTVTYEFVQEGDETEVWAVTLTVVDDMNIMKKSEPLTITVNDPNQEPEILSGITASWRVGDFNAGDYRLMFSTQISDPEGDDLTCSWIIDETQIYEETQSFDPGTTTKTYEYPCTNYFTTTGEHKVTLKITDGYFMSDDSENDTFLLDPPEVTIKLLPQDEETIKRVVPIIDLMLDSEPDYPSGELISEEWTINGAPYCTGDWEPWSISDRGEYRIEFTVMNTMHLEGSAQKTVYAYKPSKEVVVVIDHSGSMNDGIKWPAALGALNLYSEISSYLHGTIEELSDDQSYNEMDQMGIVSYTSSTGSSMGIFTIWDFSTPADNIHTWPVSTGDGTSLTPLPIEISNDYNFPEEYDWTPTGEALTQALELFEGEGSLPDETPGTDKEKYIILITDGQNNSGAVTIEEFIQTRNNHDNDKINDHKVYAIVIGDDTHSWPEQIAELAEWETGAEYRVSQEEEAMSQFFLEIFGQESNTNVIQPYDEDPNNKWANFAIDENNRVFFIAVWENVPDTHYRLRATAPDGTVIQAFNIADYDNVFESSHENNYAFIVVDNTITEGNTIDMHGNWSIDLMDEDGGEILDSEIVDARYFALVNLRLDADFSLDKKIHGTGDEIILTAKIDEYGKPVTGAIVRAHVTYPQEGAGETMSQFIFPTYNPPKRDTKSIMYHHLRAAWGEEQRDTILTGENIILLKDDGTGKDITAGDGIYTAVFDQLEYEGNYTFTFSATGKNSLNQTFMRTETLSSFVRCQVDPEASEWHYWVNPKPLDDRKDNLKELIVFFEPKDQYGRHLGPYMNSLITFDVRGGRPDPTFYYDADHRHGAGGVYCQRILFNEWVDVPTVTIKVRDKVIAKNIVVRTFNALDLSLYGGTFFIDDRLGFLRNPLPYTLGIRLTINPVRVLGIEVDIGVTGYNFNATQDLLLQGSGNLIFNMGSFVNLGKVLYPYFAIGTGVFYFHGFSIDDYFLAVNTGIGFKYDILQFLQFRFDCRYYLIFDLSGYDQIHNIQVTGGLVIGF